MKPVVDSHYTERQCHVKSAIHSDSMPFSVLSVDSVWLPRSCFICWVTGVSFSRLVNKNIFFFYVEMIAFILYSVLVLGKMCDLFEVQILKIDECNGVLMCQG